MRAQLAAPDCYPRAFDPADLALAAVHLQSTPPKEATPPLCERRTEPFRCVRWGRREGAVPHPSCADAAATAHLQPAQLQTLRALEGILFAIPYSVDGGFPEQALILSLPAYKACATQATPARRACCVARSSVRHVPFRPGGIQPQGRDGRAAHGRRRR